MKNIVISNNQLTILTSVFVVGASPLIIPNMVASIAGRDSWLSVIIATVAGLSVVWINTYLTGSYPDKTFVEISQQLMGKWLGGFVSLTLIIIELLAGTDVIWYVGDFFTTTYMTGASNYTVNVLFIAVLAIALLYGLETIARAREVLFILILTLYITVAIFLIPKYKIENIFPIMENGVAPTVKGIFPLLNNAVFPLICLNMFLAKNIKNIKAAKKSIFKGYLLGMFEIFIGMTVCILVVGANITADLRYSLFAVTKEIDVGTVFSRIEAFIVIVWLVVSFFAATIYIYAGIFGLSQVLKLKDYKKIVLPVSLIVAVYSGFVYKNVPNQLNTDNVVRTPVAIAFGFVLPVIILVISLIRKKAGKKTAV